MIKNYDVSRLRIPAQFTAVIIFLLLPPVTLSVVAQSDATLASPNVKTTEKEGRDDPANSFGELLVKQQITRRKKEHDELLKRGDEVLKLSKELEESFDANDTLSSQDITKLQTLEKVVAKIRSDLGGDDDESTVSDNEIRKNSAKQSVVEAFRFLQESTRQLVDEIKKTTRFSISAAAIQTSNAVIHFARFLRLKK